MKTNGLDVARRDATIEMNLITHKNGIRVNHGYVRGVLCETEDGTLVLDGIETSLTEGATTIFGQFIHGLNNTFAKINELKVAGSETVQ